MDTRIENLLEGLARAAIVTSVVMVLLLYVEVPSAESGWDAAPGDVTRKPRSWRGNALNIPRTEPLTPEETAEAETLFNRLLALRRGVVTGNLQFDVVPSPRYDWEVHFRWREARLFALGYPEVAERRACQVLLDPVSDRRDRELVFKMLAVLARAGSRSVKRFLGEQSGSDNSEYAKQCLFLLSEVEASGEYDDLLRSAASRGDEGALYALSYRLHGKNESVLLKEKESPVTIRSQAAEFYLEKYALLKDRRGPERIRELLKETQDHEMLTWALDAGRVNGLAGYLRILRERLDGARKPQGFDERELDSIPPRGTLLYDEILLAYAQAGGRLDESECSRLQYFGYGGDPRVRLAQILSKRD